MAVKERVRAGGRSARIQSAVHDAVKRLSKTTARDALLSVGASLMGIVLNDSAKPTQAYPPSTGGRPSGEATTAADRSAELAKRMRAGR